MPNFVQKIIERFSAKGLGVGVSSDPFTLWFGKKKVSSAKAMADYENWVYACTRAIAEEIANMNWRLFEVNTNGEATEVYDHPIINLLSGVNETMTGYELKYLTGAHLELIGNSYWFLDGAKSETDQPTAIYPLQSDKVQVEVDRSVFPNRVVGYSYTNNGNIYKFQTYQILHLKYPDPNNQFEGIGTVQAISGWVANDNYAMEFNTQFFRNGARIGGVLESATARSDSQLQFLKKSFDNIHKGYGAAYKTLILPVGTKYTPASETQKDMDFANLMDKMRDRILAGFRVPRTVLGITDDVNRANAEATNYVFALRTVKPKMELIRSYLNEFLVPRYGNNLYLEFDDPVPENTEMKINEMGASNGILSPNEQRERYFGYEPIENGNNVLIPFNVMPLGGPTAPTKQVNRRGSKNNRPSRKMTKYAKAAQMRKDLTDAFGEKMADAMKSFKIKQTEVSQKKVKELNEDDFEILYRGFAMRVDNYVKAVANALKTLNAGQKERVIANLPDAVKSFKGKAIDKSALMDLESETQITIDLTTPALTDLYEKESLEAAKILGISAIDVLANPNVKAALDRSIELMSRSYNETTLELLKDKLTQASAEGSSIREMTGLVEQIFEYNDTARAEMVARTESFRVANDSTKTTWKQSGVVTTIKWYTAADQRVCPWCGPLHGKTISIDDNFFNQGDTVDSSDGKTMDVNYADVGSPPLHPDCRCYTRPEDLVESA